MNRKKVIAALASVAALASLAACGGVKDGGAATGNTITVGTTDKITSLDPAGSYDNGSYAVQIQVFPFLYAQNYNTSELSPDIAADDGTWSADGTEFTVKLKKGLKFANGHDLTASDVKFSFDRIKKINDENGPSSLLANIESVETKDDTTVVFHSAVKDDVTLKQVLSSPAGPIVDEESFSADKLTDANTIVKDNAFAGPYKLTSYKVNEALAYAKNDSYKGLTPAKNDVVQVKYFADSSNLKMAVQQGQVDVAYRSMTPTDVEDLSKDNKVKVVKGPGGEERFLAFNFKIMPYGEKSSEPNADKAKAVRQAVASLIDRNELATKVYKSTYTPLYSFIPDGLSGHDDTLKAAYGDGSGKPDAAKAKKTLEAAGVKTPVDLKLQYNPDHYGQSSADEYAAIKAQLEEGGLFKVDLQSTEWTQFNKDRVVTEDSDGSYPVYQLGWFPDYSDPDNYLSPFFRDGNFVNNGYSNKEVNDLIVKQAGETDAKAREDLLKEIQKLETDDLSTIPLLQGAQVAVTGSNVKGVVLDASFRFRYSSVTKELQKRIHAAGYDRPLIVQYIDYLGGLLHGDLGTTLTDNQKVSTILTHYGAATFELAFLALIVALIVGIGLGRIAARKRDHAADAGIRTFAILCYATPVFFLGLILKLIFAIWLNVLPASGRSSLGSEMQFSRLVSPTGFYIIDAIQLGDMSVLLDVLRHAVLPALALGLLTAGVFIRLVRTNVIATYHSGYVEAARSRGVSEKRLLNKHAWKPALIPIITVMGMQIALMLAGAVLTETTFEWKGLGFMLSQYLKARDFVAVQGIVILIAIIVAVVNFIVDVIAALVDPRVRY